MPITKDEKLEIITAERQRLEHGLYAAELDVRVSEASPDDAKRLEAAMSRLQDVKARIEAVEAIARTEIEQSP